MKRSILTILYAVLAAAMFSSAAHATEPCLISQFAGRYASADGRSILHFKKSTNTTICDFHIELRSSAANNNAAGPIEMPTCTCSDGKEPLACYVHKMLIKANSVYVWNKTTNNYDRVGTCSGTKLDLIINNVNSDYPDAIRFLKGHWQFEKVGRTLNVKINFNTEYRWELIGVLQPEN